MLYAVTHGSGTVWLETLKWLGFNLVGSLFPIWGTYILLRIQSKPLTVSDFVIHGELALYSAAFISPLLWVILRNMRADGPLLSSGAVLVGLSGLLVSVTLYSGILLAPVAPDGKHIMDEVFIKKMSLILFGVSLLFAILVEFTNEQPANPKKVEEEEQGVLSDRLDQKQPVPTRVQPITDDNAASELPTQEEMARKFKAATGVGENG